MIQLVATDEQLETMMEQRPPEALPTPSGRDSVRPKIELRVMRASVSGMNVILNFVWFRSDMKVHRRLSML